ncbi:hypothetical protein [Variovorax sp. PvP013]|uniref:hypothetical protein n=1 Tax=Variovorax sp. PvP013 TaxID=3156435 RepID=UPI003D2158D9
MGRAAVIVLALANLGYLAWSRGALATFDLVPADLAAREPQRLARQILPERLRVVTPAQEREEARARAEAEVQAQARLRAQTREIRTTASATLAGSGTVIGVSEPVVLSVLPDPSAPTDRSASPRPSTPPAPAASAPTSEPSRPASAAR